MDWANVLENALPIFTICGAFFLWLRQDNKRLDDKLGGQITQLRNDMNTQNQQLRDDMRSQNQQLRNDVNGQIGQLRNDVNRQIGQLRDDTNNQHRQLRDEMNARFDSIEGRLRGVETEQARVAGLLEGLALTGRLPDRESDLG